METTRETAPLLSIITPVQNAAPWLKDCIHSAQNQNFKDWEWIWVDDHSTDNSWELLQREAALDSRIQVFRDTGKGIIPALQQALQKCGGTYVTRMDADDIMPARRLSIMVNALQQAAPQTIVTGPVKYFPRETLGDGYRQYEKWLNQVVSTQSFGENMYRECVVASPNWMMRRQDLLDIGGFDGLEYPEDYDLTFRWYRHGFQFKAVDAVTLHWREHPQRTSRNSDHYSQEAFFRLKIKRFVELEKTAGRDIAIWGDGTKARLAAKTLRELEVPFIWMVLNPEKYPNGIERQPVQSFRDTPSLNHPLVLLTVYPPEPQKHEMESFLAQNSLKAGRDYWYL
mgnify:CR=1 FL=1